MPIYFCWCTSCIWLKTLQIDCFVSALKKKQKRKTSIDCNRWVLKLLLGQTYRQINNPYSNTTLIERTTKKFSLMNIQISKSRPSHIHSIMASYWLPRENLLNWEKIISGSEGVQEAVMAWSLEKVIALPLSFRATHITEIFRQDWMSWIEHLLSDSFDGDMKQ